MVFIEQVQIRFESISRGLNQQTERLSKQLTNISDKNKKLNNTISPVSKGFEDYRKNIITQTRALADQVGVLGLSRKQFTAFNEVGGRFNTRLQRMTNGLRLATAGTKGFRMEMLGLLFFGLLIKQFFTGLLSPAAKLTATFDLMQILLEVFFLPTMLQVQDAFIGVFDTLIDSSETTKKVGGAFTVLGAIFGVLFFLVGAVTLGFGSLTEAWITLRLVLLRTTKVFFSLIAILLILNGLFQTFSALNEDVSTGLRNMFIGILKMTGGFLLLSVAVRGLSATLLLIPGVAVILGIILVILTLTKLTSWSLNKQDKEYTSTWAAILGTVIDAIAGIVLLIFSIPAAFIEAGKAIFKTSFRIGGGIASAIKAGLKGQDPFKAFFSEFDGFGDELQKSFVDNVLLPGAAIANFSTTIKEKIGIVQDKKKKELDKFKDVFDPSINGLNPGTISQFNSKIPSQFKFPKIEPIKFEKKKVDLIFNTQNNFEIGNMDELMDSVAKANEPHINKLKNAIEDKINTINSIQDINSNTKGFS